MPMDEFEKLGDKIKSLSRKGLTRINSSQTLQESIDAAIHEGNSILLSEVAPIIKPKKSGKSTKKSSNPYQRARCLV
jgi:hypothetical protein